MVSARPTLDLNLRLTIMSTYALRRDCNRARPVKQRLTARASPSARILRHVVVDDVQWIDPVSAALLRYVAFNLRRTPILLVAAYRPEDSGGEREVLGRRRHRRLMVGRRRREDDPPGLKAIDLQ